MLNSRDRSTYYVSMYITYGVMLLILMIAGAVLGDMSIRYRRVTCSSYTSDRVNFIEHTTGFTFDASLAVSPTKKPNLPADCWTDTRHAVFYDPAIARDIFFITWGGIMFIIVIANIIVEKMFQPEPSTQSSIQLDRRNCENCCCFNFRVFAFIALALIVGGAVIGDRYNRFVEGSCTQFKGLGDRYGCDRYGCGGSVWAVNFDCPTNNNGTNCLDYKTKAREIEWTSPRPYNGGNCWSDGNLVTFIDPYLVMIYYFCAIGGVFVLGMLSSLFIFIFPAICCKKETSATV